MRDDQDLIQDVVKSAQAIVDYISLLPSVDDAFNDKKTVDAIFFHIVVLGEAVNSLRADPKKKRRKLNAEIINENPQVPWNAWAGMRNKVAHEYFRRDPEIVKTDYENGNIGQILNVCCEWLNAKMDISAEDNVICSKCQSVPCICGDGGASGGPKL